jgi:hypothetical protein
VNFVSQLADRHSFWEQWHPYVLTRKGILGADLLDDAIVIDMASSAVSIAELRSRTVGAVVSHLELGTTAQEVVGEFLIDDRLDHLGFRIHAPMDVYLEALPLLAADLGWVLEGTKRFAPSAWFQDRVGASAEMAQVWLGTDDAVFQLELFDIHMPVGGDRSVNSAAARHVLADPSRRPPDALSWPPFGSDDIWHYGVLVASIADVAVIHDALMEDSSDLAFRNDEVVANLWHGSHHTKVAGGSPAIEIEFLAYLDDWSDV